MPELPEVETIVLGLCSILPGKVVTSVKFYRETLRDQIPQGQIKEVLVGELVLRVFRRSKYILIETKIGFVIIHLGMTGNVLYSTSSTPKVNHTHIVIALGKSTFLHYVDPRRFGRFAVHKGKDWERHRLLALLGPEPLETPRLADHLFALSRGRATSIKSLLMNAHHVVGVGNIYACESLFAAGIDPRARSGEVTLAQYRILSHCIKRILRKAIKAGGTTLKHFKDAEGNPGYFAISLNVYGRAQKQCLECGNTILKIPQSGRTTFFCAFCQS